MIDFFLIGGAKCGSTSLAKYLDEHSSIEITKVKETKYLSYKAGVTEYRGPGDQAVYNQIIKSMADLMRLFPSSKQPGTLYGEASCDNLYYSKDVIPLMKEINPEAKIIIILRNPIDRAYSAYKHLVRDGREMLNFEDALALEKKRINQYYEFLWHYKKAGLYSENVKQYMENFANVIVIFQHDLNENPQPTLNKIFRFLNLDEISLVNNQRYNQSKEPNSSVLHHVYKFITKDVHRKGIVTKIIKFLLPGNIRHCLLKVTKELLFSSERQIKIQEETRVDLLKFFREDIIALECLVGKDLTVWKE